MHSSSQGTPEADQRGVDRRVPLLHNRNYLLLWSGQAISKVGSGISDITFPLLTLALTGSAAQAGFVGTALALPYLFLGVVAGALVDRWDRKRVMIICELGRAAALGSIWLVAALGHLTVIQLYAAAAVSGTLLVFFSVSQTASLPRVVPKVQLAEATGWNLTTSNMAGLAAPPFGGFLYQALGRTVPFLVDAVSYVVSAVSLFFISERFQEERKARSRHLGVEIKEGLGFLWNQPILRFTAFLNGAGTLIDAGVPLILIVLARREHATPLLIGLMFALGGIGGIVGSSLAARLLRRLGFRHATISVMWVLAFLYPLYAIAPHPLLLGLISACVALVAPLYITAFSSYQLAIVPDALQGRVAGAIRILSSVGWPLGLALMGVLIQDLGAVSTMLLISLVNVGIAVATTMNRSIRLVPDSGDG